MPEKGGGPSSPARESPGQVPHNAYPAQLTAATAAFHGEIPQTNQPRNPHQSPKPHPPAYGGVGDTDQLPNPRLLLRRNRRTHNARHRIVLHYLERVPLQGAHLHHLLQVVPQHG